VVAAGRRRHAEKRFRKRLKREAKMQERRDLRASAKMRDDFGMAIERDDFRERLAEKKAAAMRGGAA